MLYHSVFGPLAQPPVGIRILHMGTTLRTMHQNGKIVKHKVHIIVKGYSQVPGLHFNETYAPVMH